MTTTQASVLEALPAEFGSADWPGFSDEQCVALGTASASTLNALVSTRPVTPGRFLPRLVDVLNSTTLKRSAKLGALTALSKLAALEKHRDSVFESLLSIEETFEKALRSREKAHAERGDALGKYHELVSVTLMRCRDYKLAAAHLLEFMHGDPELCMNVLSGILGAPHYEDALVLCACTVLQQLTDPNIFYGDLGDGEFAIDDTRVLDTFCERASAILELTKWSRLLDVAAVSFEGRLFPRRAAVPRRRREAEAEAASGSSDSKTGPGPATGGGSSRAAARADTMPTQWQDDVSDEARAAVLSLMKFVRNLYVFSGDGETVLYRLLAFSEVVPKLMLPFVLASARSLRDAARAGRGVDGPNGPLRRSKEAVILGLRLLAVASFRVRAQNGTLRAHNPTPLLLSCGDVVTGDPKLLALLCIFNVNANGFTAVSHNVDSSGSGSAKGDGGDHRIEGADMMHAWLRCVSALSPAQKAAVRRRISERGWLPLCRDRQSWDAVEPHLSGDAMDGGAGALSDDDDDDDDVGSAHTASSSDEGERAQPVPTAGGAPAFGAGPAAMPTTFTFDPSAPMPTDEEIAAVGMGSPSPGRGSQAGDDGPETSSGDAVGDGKHADSDDAAAHDDGGASRRKTTVTLAPSSQSLLGDLPPLPGLSVASAKPRHSGSGSKPKKHRKERKKHHRKANRTKGGRDGTGVAAGRARPPHRRQTVPVDEPPRPRWYGEAPKDFMCAITHDVMRNPVLSSKFAAVGEAERAAAPRYERSTIERWLEARAHVCPVTGRPLAAEDLVADEELSKRITVWHVQRAMAANAAAPTAATAADETDLYDFS